MIRGFYTALSGVLASMNRQAVVADNIANVNTTGFKASRTTQDDFELQIMNSLGPEIGVLGMGTTASGLKIDTSQGALEQTGVPTDMAISGDGLFVVRTGSGVAYTRDGNFELDATGKLVTEQGFPVLDTAGHDITPGGNFTVGKDGTVSGTGQRIALVGWPPGGVTRLGQNLYAAGGTLTPGPGIINQGMIEHSNTDLGLEMTDMISIQRSFQMSSRAMSIQDSSVGDAVQLGRLR
jgi:flagellar basal body rod protein FlgG